MNVLPPEPDKFPQGLYIIEGRRYLIPSSEFEKHHLDIIWEAGRTDPEARRFFTDRGLPAPRLQPQRQPGLSDNPDAR
jgi:hypothetical protein